MNENTGILPSVKGLSRLALGLSKFGSVSGIHDKREAAHLLDLAYECGIRVFDTSNIYGQGDSERFLGEFLARRRDKSIFIVSKAGRKLSGVHGGTQALKRAILPILPKSVRRMISGRRRDLLQFGLTYDEITASVEGSLRRLQVDTIDGLLLHSPPPGIPLDEAFRALEDLRRSGKIAEYGASCDDAQVMRAAAEMPGATLLELSPSLVDAYAGQVDPISKSGRLRILEREVIASRPHLSPLDAVRASLSSDVVDATIVGTTNASHLREIAALCRPHRA